MLDDLVAWLRALMAGEFEETVWVVRENEAFRAKGEIVVGGVPVTIFWRSGFGFFRRKAYMRRTYAPYCPPE